MKNTKKTDIYQEITDRVIAQLEKGEIPWEKEWSGSWAYNRDSKKKYSLLNCLMLDAGGEWATFKQWQKHGGSVRKGEHGKHVVFWSMIEKPDGTDDDGKPKTKRYPVLKWSTVFEISQVDGVEPLNLYTPKMHKNDPIKFIDTDLEKYYADNGIKYHEKVSGKAYFTPALKEITMPQLNQFTSPEAYYCTKLHESIHSTGHKDILNRDDMQKIAAFGSKNYSKEELTAEIGSAALAKMYGINTAATDRNTTAYLQAWIKELKNDKRLLISAASKAQKAVDYIKNYSEILNEN